MSENTLKARIDTLKADLVKKDHEIHRLLDRIEELEDTIMRLEALIPDEDDTKKSKKKQAVDSKLVIELDEKDRQIRELKNKMGFLRKEKVQLQQELERIKSRSNESSVIRVEEFRDKTPLNALVKDLQEKINKQESLIHKLRNEIASNKDFDKKLNEKDKVISILKSEITELNRKIKEFSTIDNDNEGDTLSKKLIDDLQQQLNKYKRKISELTLKLEESTEKHKRENKGKGSLKTKDLQKEIKNLNESLKNKDKEIDELKKKNISLQKADIAASFDKNDISSTEMIEPLNEDLKKKLNIAKLQIKTLQEQIKTKNIDESLESSMNKGEFKGKLKMQREMAIFLQKQLDTKEGEIEMIKNEAVQIKAKYRQLENQIQIKDQKIRELQRQLDELNIQPQVISKKEDPNLALRVRELKNKMESLEKLNNEHKLEISQLRKNI
ncbi:MAG: hypothetical protein ACFFCE_02220 [Promethearchaeota archaeon]